MNAPEPTTADPISAAVIRAGLASTAREVFAQFVRTSLTPTIYDSHDFSVAVFDDQVNVVGDASGLPEYVGSLAFTVEAVVEAFGRDRLEEGDTVICSQPYLTGAHPPDIAVVSPAFADGELVGFCAIRGHMGDSGARNAYPADANSSYEEGLMLPPVKFVRAGVVDEVISEIVAANSRMPRETVGNLKSAAAATRAGAGRIAALVTAHGEASYRLAIDELLNRGERAVRAVLESIPDGEYRVEDELDNTGYGPGVIPLVVTVRISGSEIEVDVTGSGPQQYGALNVPYKQTVAACRLALKRLTTEDTMPANSGEYRPLTVTAPEGSIFNAQAPAGSFMMHVAASVLSEMVVTALMPALSERVPAPTAGHTTALLAEFPSGMVQVGDAAPIGYGALDGRDGASALQHFSISGIETASAEVWEAQAPAMKVRYELVTDTGGPGKWRGGLGTVVEWRFDEAASLTIQGQRTGSLADTGRGGGSAARGANDARVAAGTDHELSTGMSTDVPVGAGEAVVLNGAGGGGYGPAAERDPEAVAADVREGFVSVESAARDYLVAVSADGVLDIETTTELRTKGARA
ncbi:hydantoinase B/oxoprolinase family protein [Amnibacterium flavum]|nr:hydantoinase B/oxoprolinase family protein [Amnibacterium flavum]